jgi:rhamnose utilization protein RhaD (predicted bifunctional aldolase and dehydrogenase)/NAD(P)-dependent dehydrogenase (short-subunit alcohol dehydrogenase family)
MINKWSDENAKTFTHKFEGDFGIDLCELAYVTRLIGEEPGLALHGGGNTSIKSSITDIFGDKIPALYVKASGFNMASITPPDFVTLDGEYLLSLKKLHALSDEAMADEFRLHQLKASKALPSIETLMHAFIPGKCIVHTHPSAILALTNREHGEDSLREAIWLHGSIIPYVKVGFDLAAAVAKTLDENPHASAVVIMHHGLVTWGPDPKTAYAKTIEIVSAAENYVISKIRTAFLEETPEEVQKAAQRYTCIAPIIRGLLSPRTSDVSDSNTGILVKPLISSSALAFVNSPDAKRLALTSPLTPDYLIRTKTFPLWIDEPKYDDVSAFREQMAKAISEYAHEYKDYVFRHLKTAFPQDLDALPRVALLPGIGAVCVGRTDSEASMVCDITQQAIEVKQAIFHSGGVYQGLSEDHLFDMEFRSFQRAKIHGKSADPLEGSVALVTGSAGAIGTGICQALLEAGCNVAVTDLPGVNLDSMVSELTCRFPGRVLGVGLDVTDESSIATGFAEVVGAWGGIDCVIANAGIAHVCALEDMNLEAFRKLERVNVDGTLLIIKEAARHFKLQNRGGDIILISTKNVFAPGAKFGAYSATKAAAHQLARIASLELAGIGVRVNMVAPDAVFSHGEKKSGLWAEVGPDRMKARGLDEAGLEDYYRTRNLLKAKVTARHVANAVLFFITHQTPTTGATIPVDGGLPDATPR